jgi:hypothetical protein
MPEVEQSEVAERLFGRTGEEIRDAIKLEDERRAALVKNLYRLRALRLERDRNRKSPEDEQIRLADSGKRGSPKDAVVHSGPVLD